MRPQRASDDEEETGNEACAEREEAVSADITANTIARLQDELMEQARANGAGASRELALRSTIAELQRENLALRKAQIDLVTVAKMAKAYFEQSRSGRGIEDPIWHMARKALNGVEP
jgi:hypothetical protein